MQNKHICKLCSKSFCNGRALGGHMKSHLVSSQPSTQKKLADSVHSSSCSSSDAIVRHTPSPPIGFSILKAGLNKSVLLSIFSSPSSSIGLDNTTYGLHWCWNLELQLTT